MGKRKTYVHFQTHNISILSCLSTLLNFPFYFINLLIIHLLDSEHQHRCIQQMKQALILFVVFLYLLIQSETYSYLPMTIRFNCSYSQEKSTPIRTNLVLSRLISNIGISNFYVFITNPQNDKKLVIQNIHCVHPQYSNGICNQSFESMKYASIHSLSFSALAFRFISIFSK